MGHQKMILSFKIQFLLIFVVKFSLFLGQIHVANHYYYLVVKGSSPPHFTNMNPYPPKIGKEHTSLSLLKSTLIDMWYIYI